MGIDYDHIDVTGTAIIDRELEVLFINDFRSVVNESDMFEVLTAQAAIVGQFPNVLSGGQLATSNGSGSFEVFYGAGSPFGIDRIILTNFVPEPTTLVVLLVGALTLAKRR